MSASGPGGGVYPNMQWGRHPPGQTDTCENITFANFGSKNYEIAHGYIVTSVLSFYSKWLTEDFPQEWSATCCRKVAIPKYSLKEIR